MDIKIDNDCGELAKIMAVYDVKTATALWCTGGGGYPVNEVIDLLVPIGSVGRSSIIFKHPFIQCIEPRSRLIASALFGDKPIEYWFEDDYSADNSLFDDFSDGSCSASAICYEDAKFWAKDLLNWLTEYHPSEKPAFLFDPIADNKVTNISKSDEIDELQLEKQKNIKLTEVYKRLQLNSPPSERSERTYLHAIGALVDVIMGDGFFENNEHKSNAKLIKQLVDEYGEYEGISESTLKIKFREAKKLIELMG